MFNINESMFPGNIRNKISIPTVEAVKKFVEIVNCYTCTAIIESDRYTVNAKSIMGVLSLDLTKPVMLILERNNNFSDDRIELVDAIKQYIIM